jgi:hypothetical protein
MASQPYDVHPITDIAAGMLYTHGFIQQIRSVLKKTKLSDTPIVLIELVDTHTPHRLGPGSTKRRGYTPGHNKPIPTAVHNRWCKNDVGLISPRILQSHDVVVTVIPLTALHENETYPIILVRTGSGSDEAPSIVAEICSFESIVVRPVRTTQNCTFKKFRRLTGFSYCLLQIELYGRVFPNEQHSFRLLSTLREATEATKCSTEWGRDVHKLSVAHIADATRRLHCRLRWLQQCNRLETQCAPTPAPYQQEPADSLLCSDVEKKVPDQHIIWVTGLLALWFDRNGVNGILRSWQWAELLWAHSVCKIAPPTYQIPPVYDFARLRGVTVYNDDPSVIWHGLLHILPTGHEEAFFVILSRMRQLVTDLETCEVECTTPIDGYLYKHFVQLLGQLN